MKIEYEYKIRVLKDMLKAEKDEGIGGYGVHITHWATDRAINIGADAIEALIKFYEARGNEE